MQTIHLGDVVGLKGICVQNRIMSAVIGLKTACTGNNKCVLHVNVWLLYSFHELFDSLQNYSSDLKLTNVDLGIKSRIICNSRLHPWTPGAEHKIVVAVLSNFVTTIEANQIHKILHLVFHSDTVEDVVPDRSVQKTCTESCMQRL
jgi:hypothetical protein